MTSSWPPSSHFLSQPTEPPARLQPEHWMRDTTVRAGREGHWVEQGRMGCKIHLSIPADALEPQMLASRWATPEKNFRRTQTHSQLLGQRFKALQQKGPKWGQRRDVIQVTCPHPTPKAALLGFGVRHPQASGYSLGLCTHQQPFRKRVSDLAETQLLKLPISVYWFLNKPEKRHGCFHRLTATLKAAMPFSSQACIEARKKLGCFHE